MTNYTPAQLEAWAELGPWFDMDLSGVSNEPPIPSDVIVSCSWPDIIEVACMGRALTATIQEALTNATLIAAAPDLARLVLEKDVEIARLKAAAEDLVSLCHADVKMNGTTYQPMPYRSAFTKAVERMIELINKPSPSHEGNQ